MVSPQAVRRWIMTGSIAAITMTGTIYGAGLKSRQEYNQVCQPLSVSTSVYTVPWTSDKLIFFVRGFLVN